MIKKTAHSSDTPVERLSGSVERVTFHSKESDLHCRDPWEEAGLNRWTAQGAGYGGEEPEVESKADEADG